MGYYLPIHELKGKAQVAIDMYGAVKVSVREASKAIDDQELAVICVVDNGPFEAAGFAYNRIEFEAFDLPRDKRPKEWLIMDRKKACELTGYKDQSIEDEEER